MYVRETDGLMRKRSEIKLRRGWSCFSDASERKPWDNFDRTSITVCCSEGRDRATEWPCPNTHMYVLNSRYKHSSSFFIKLFVLSMIFKNVVS